MEKQTSSKLEKEYNKAIYYHPAYLTYMHIMQNAGLDESQAGIKINGRNINNLRYAEVHPYGRKWKGTKELLDEHEIGEWKIWLKTQCSKNY